MLLPSVHHSGSWARLARFQILELHKLLVHWRYQLLKSHEHRSEVAQFL